MSKKLIVGLIVFAFTGSLLASPNLYGSRGTMRTHSAKTIGNGKLSAGISIEGSIDENKLVDNSFFSVDSSRVAQDADGNLIFDSEGWIQRGAQDPSAPDPTAQDLNAPRVSRDSVTVTEVDDFTARAFLAIGLSNFFDVGVAAPYHIDRINSLDAESMNDLGTVSGSGLGDIEVWGKLQYPPYEHDPTFDMALFAMFTFPTGDTQKGFVPKEIYYIPGQPTDPTLRGTEDYDPKYFSSGQITATLLMLWTLDFYHLNREFPLEVNLNYGITTTVKKNLDNVFVLNASLLYHLNDIVGWYGEFAGQTRFSKFENGFELGADPMYFNTGFQVNTPNGAFFSVGIDFGISQPGVADLDTLSIDNSSTADDGMFTYYQIQPVTNTAFTAIVGWEGHLVAQDKDRDGINDAEDACPDSPEDLDAYEDYDGCPEDDNDRDEIEDYLDKCPMDPEDVDGFEDEDGCPDRDNDQDGINDSKDECPMDPEDLNQFEDDDGCPESMKDTDGDGIPDVRDRCVDVKEDMDTFEDFDGCPEKDNDNDGIDDDQDKCPNKAEIMNGFEDEDGCPDMKPQPKKKPMAKKAKIVLHGVTFESGKSILKETSFEKLAGVAQTLLENPEVVIEISGHTDNRGSKKLNKKLSLARAQSVVDYLISEGVGKNQLSSKGYGPSKPVETNRTADGRAKNRRIEMMRVK